MRKSHSSNIIVVGALCCAFAMACSGGGGGGISTTNGSAAASTNMTPTTPTNGTSTNNLNSSGYDTGIAGSVAAPAAATFGTAPAQLASSGGPTFDGSGGAYASNATFPLILTGFQKTSTGLTATPGDPAATATVINDSSNSSAIQLVIPSVGLNQTITMNTNAAGAGDSGQTIYGLSYVSTGWWSALASPTRFGPFVFGYETPQTAMPTSGTAVFSTGIVQGNIYKTFGTEIQTVIVDGNVSISANFGSGAVTGSFTNMSTSNLQTWNNMALTANIATGTNKFSGTTAAASAPGTPTSLSGSATGSINGAFYGPAAQQLGAVWSLSDGTGSALGTVVAGH